MQIPGSQREHNSVMRLLYFMADAFIATFGITRPTERARKQAAFFILALLVVVVLAVAVAGLALHGVMR
jgi:hypothetical protein